MSAELRRDAGVVAARSALARRPRLQGRLVAGLFVLVTAAPLPAASGGSIEQRLQRIERLVDSGVLRDLLDRAQANEREIRALRDQVERLAHELERERLRQRDLHRDLDRRVQRLEGAAAPINVLPSPAATPADTSPATRLTPAQPTDEVQAYRQARNLLLEDRQPSAAIAAFERFLQTYPRSRYRANALYWMAEAHYGQGDYARALEGFRDLIAQFPTSDKAADAKLKLGYTYLALGDRTQARKVLEEVVAQYPNSSVARLARQKLRQLR